MKDNRPSWGLCNPNMDAELYSYYREKHSSWSNEKIYAQIQKDKKKATFFNNKNSKKNSTKKNSTKKPPKKDKKMEDLT